MDKYQIGLIGLAVMGKNLALNIENNGYTLSVYNRSTEKTKNFINENKDKNLQGFYSLKEFISSLESPKKIIMMVKAGEAVDTTINSLKPFLQKGDIIIDGGNSFYKDTIRRYVELQQSGIRFLGTGISGGEEGALMGPAIMPGGSKEAYELVEPLLMSISAKVENDACCTYIGPDGAGHYVKMVHNGIEYSDMQLISEAYFILKKLLGLSVEEIQSIFEEWNKGELDSYLVEITSDILTKHDPNTGLPMVDIILDVANQKGTGKWTSQSALDFSVSTPTVTEAVFARCISEIKEERLEASKIIKGPEVNRLNLDNETLIESVRKALYSGKICAYAQGFALMRAASIEHNWNLDFKHIAMIFRGGCIIRARFLNRIMDAYASNPELKNLMLNDYFLNILEKYQDSWRYILSTAILNGIAIPAFTSALSYFDSYRSDILPTNLIQAQRDYFGAHSFKRIDQEGDFHYNWY